MIAVVFNVDSIHVARTLYTDRDVRTAMVDAAKSYTDKNPTLPTDKTAAPASSAAPAPPTSEGTSATPTADGTSTDADSSAVGDPALYLKLKNSANAFDSVANGALLPVGWKDGFFKLPKGDLEKLYLFVGWLLTGAALSLGAPSGSTS